MFRPMQHGHVPNLQGGVLLNKTPKPIPWPVFIGCGLRVLNDGKPLAVAFEPEHIEAADELLQLVRFLLAASTPKPGPIAWETVPAEIQRHFKVSAAPAP